MGLNLALIISLLALTTLLVLILFRAIYFYLNNRENNSPPPNGFSIIIPFRNEAHNLQVLLTDLINQEVEIPYEIILINDRSTDNYDEIISSTLRLDSRITLLNSTYDETINLTSKQQALELGVENSRYEWLIFTDGDMQFSPLWLNNFLETIIKSNSLFIFARTAIRKSNNLFSYIQKLQLDFLFATAYLFTKARVDSSCMGNNLAINRDLYIKIGGQRGIGYSIVEDKKLYNLVKASGVIPATASDFSPFAYTYPVSNIQTYTHQLIRWLKGGATESLFLGFTALLWGIELISLLLTIFNFNSSIWQIIAILNITIVSTTFISLYHKIKEIKSLPLLPLYILFAIFESILIIPLAIFIKPKWKGNRLK